MKTRDAAVVGALFVFSGMSGLVYEVVWLRYLTLTIGHTTFAVSVVVSAFLGGLVVGSLLFGRLADAVRRPLLLFALLETLTGLLAVGVSLLLRDLPGLMGSLVVSCGGPTWLRVALCFALLMPPTAAMGGTLPALTRFVARDLPRVGRHFGTLYALNTFGAALGTALTGFYLIATLGLFRTTLLAASVNLTVALCAALLHAAATRGSDSSAPTEATPSSPDAPRVAPLHGRHRGLLIAAFALSGFASISCEVLWFRVLGLFLRSSTYAFAVLLSTFLLGLVIGGLLYVLWFSRRGRDLELFASAHLLMAFLIPVSVALLGLSRLFSLLLGPAFGAEGQALAMFLHASIVILVPATTIGLVFPLVVQLTTTHLRTTGTNVGLLYSVNTLGGILGSLVMGFVSVPLIGTQASFCLVAILYAGLGLLGQHLIAVRTARRRRVGWVLAALVVPAVLILPRDYLNRAYAETPLRKVLEIVEGRDGTLAVVEHSDEIACSRFPCPDRCLLRPYRHRRLLFGSVSYASTILTSKRYMSVLAHLPMLTQEDPKQVLVVCFGTGITAGTFGLYPGMESLTAVDLNPDVIRAGRWFADHNRRILQDPRTHVVIDDGRHFLLTSDRKFDVISFEPPPPSSPGVVNLYTREFYALVASHLHRDGILSQWIPLQQQSDEINRMLLRSVRDVFAYVTLWIPAREEAVVLASQQPLVFDLDRWAERWRSPAIRRSLSEIGYEDPYALAGDLFLGPPALRSYTDGVSAVTDDLPAVEYYLSRDDRPFDRRALTSLAFDEDLFRAERLDRPRLERAHAASRLMLRASALARANRNPEARRLVRKAVETAGPDAYRAHLLNLEYDCLVPRKYRDAPPRDPGSPAPPPPR